MKRRADRTRGRVHFIGIAGIGVSALAQWYHSEGWRVTGSDPHDSENLAALREKGIRIRIGTVRSSVDAQAADRVIHTVASPQDRAEAAELRAAREAGKAVFTYPQALGEITRRYKTIAVAGAHGKSTTTAMIALMMIRAKLDPTVIVGTKLREFNGTNFRKGKSEYLVVEADEYRAAFLNYMPWIGVVLNVDREHLDFYKTYARIKSAFRSFIARIPAKGALVANFDHPDVKKLVRGTEVPLHGFSARTERAAEVKKTLPLSGAHMLSNAMAADVVGEVLGIPLVTRDEAHGAFRGVWRRFEFKGHIGPARFFDDYGHHPAEIAATLDGAKESFPGSRLIAIFRPHHAERLTALFREFSRAFKDASEIAVLDTYRVKGREGISRKKMRTSRELVAALRKRHHHAAYYAKFDDAIAALKPTLRAGDVIVLFTAEAR